jgi:hypothetical protein
MFAHTSEEKESPEQGLGIMMEAVTTVKVKEMEFP